MNKTILITGASRGIGYETALKLAANKHTVIATARTEKKLKKLSNAAKSGKIIPVSADLTKDEDIQKLAAVMKDYDTLNGLINNAGAVHRESFMDTDISVFQELMDVNLFGVIRLIKALKAKLKKGSHIINISSMSGYQGSLKFTGLTAYGASKAAVVGFSEILSTEFAEEGISVNCLCLGAVQTEMFEDAFPGFSAPVSPQQMGGFLADFVLNGHQFFNGKVLPVALNNPE